MPGSSLWPPPRRGGRRTLGYELGIRERAGRWEITSISGAPALDDQRPESTRLDRGPDPAAVHAGFAERVLDDHVVRHRTRRLTRPAAPPATNHERENPQ